MWRGPGNVHGFALDGKPYRQGWVTAQTPTMPAVSSVRIRMPVLCTCNLTTTACGRRRVLSPITRRSSQELLALCLNNSNNNHPSHGWHTLDIKCLQILPTAVHKTLVGNRFGVSLTRSAIRPLLPSLFPVKEAPCGVDRATSMASPWMENPTDKDRLLPKHQLCRPFLV